MQKSCNLTRTVSSLAQPSQAQYHTSAKYTLVGCPQSKGNSKVIFSNKFLKASWHEINIFFNSWSKLLAMWFDSPVQSWNLFLSATNICSNLRGHDWYLVSTWRFTTDDISFSSNSMITSCHYNLRIMATYLLVWVTTCLCRHTSLFLFFFDVFFSTTRRQFFRYDSDP